MGKKLFDVIQSWNEDNIDLKAATGGVNFYVTMVSGGKDGKESTTNFFAKISQNNSVNFSDTSISFMKEKLKSFAPNLNFSKIKDKTVKVDQKKIELNIDEKGFVTIK